MGKAKKSNGDNGKESVENMTCKSCQQEFLKKYNYCPYCGRINIQEDRIEESDQLELDLDGIYEDGYFYTEYDVGGCGHKIIINTKDKEVFLDAWAKEWRNKAEAGLTPVEDEDDNDEDE